MNMQRKRKATTRTASPIRKSPSHEKPRARKQSMFRAIATCMACSAFFALGPIASPLPAQRSIADEPKPQSTLDPIRERKLSVPLANSALVDENNPIRKLFGGTRLDLWSLQPIARPAIPDVADRDWCWNPIDRFVLARWERDGFTPAGTASPSTILHRLTLDLTGLKPDDEEVAQWETHSNDGAFAAQSHAADTFSQRIETLLSSPRFGEHWARLWLDIARYSDSNGFDWDEFRPNAWRYRDYVIRSWNRDLPYSVFVTQQLAGDLIQTRPPENEDERDCLIATGFLRLGPYDNAAKLFDEQDRARAEVLTDLTETTASAFLAMTMSCCRCHDHKTDPLSQEDHYRFRAFFAGTQFADDLPIDLAEVQHSIQTHNAEVDAQIAALEKQKEELLQLDSNGADSESGKADAASLNDKKQSKKERKKLLDKAKAKLSKSDTERLQAIEAQIKDLQGNKQTPTFGLLMTDKPESADAIHVLRQGDHKSPLQEVAPGFPSVLFPGDANAIARDEDSKNGDKPRASRMELAQWLFQQDNPWTARVIVNRVWQQLFGVGLVDTPNDFGLSGNRPIHPELLDYLACDLIDHDWSIKHLIHTIVTSHTYHQEVVATNGQLEESSGDSTRTHTASMRSHLRRLSAEQLRDSMLQVSGLLQTRAGGPPVWPKLSEDVLQANPAVLDDNETKTKGWYPSPDSQQSVRSIYLVQKRTLRIPWMETFDLPENTTSCPRRETSIVAPQALTMMNGELTLNCASAISELLSHSNCTNDEQRVEWLFARILRRSPNEAETNRCIAFLAEHDALDLALVLLNSNEFIFER